MAWGYLALALVLGAVVSAGLYFAVYWPRDLAPEDEGAPEVSAEEPA